MPNTFDPTTENPETLNISDIDSDWLWSDSFDSIYPDVRIISIQFNPGATDDHCVIKEGSAAGHPIFDVTCENEYDQRIEYKKKKALRPVLDFSAGTYSAGSTIKIEFDL